MLRFLCYFNSCVVCTIIFQARSIALEAMATLSNVTDILSSLAVVGDEPLVMSVPQMSIVLQKITSDIEGEHIVEDGQVSVHFPSVSEVLTGNMAGKYVDLQVLESNKLIISFKNVNKIECIVSLYPSASHLKLLVLTVYKKGTKQSSHFYFIFRFLFFPTIRLHGTTLR